MSVLEVFVRPLDVIERVAAGDIDRQRTVDQSREDVGLGEMVGKAWPCQKERTGLPEFDRVEVFDVSAHAAETDDETASMLVVA